MNICLECEHENHEGKICEHPMISEGGYSAKCECEGHDFICYVCNSPAQAIQITVAGNLFLVCNEHAEEERGVTNITGDRALKVLTYIYETARVAMYDA